MNEVITRAKQDVTARTLNALKSGVIPWRTKRAEFALPVNASTGKEYNGINVVSLLCDMVSRGSDDPRYATFNQARAKGWKVRRGEHGTKIFYFEVLSKKEVENDKEKIVSVPMLKIYTVFNAAQIDGLPPLAGKINDSISAELERLALKHGVSPEGSAESVCRELVYSALKDSSVSAVDSLTVELGTAFLAGALKAELDGDAVSDMQRESWIQLIERTPEALFRAAADANKVTEYIRTGGKINESNAAD